MTAPMTPDELLEQFLHDHPEGASAEAIGREVMLLKGPAALVERIASAALSRTAGIERGDDGLYRIARPVHLAAKLSPVRPVDAAPAVLPDDAPRATSGGDDALAWSDAFRARRGDEELVIEPWSAPEPPASDLASPSPAAVTADADDEVREPAEPPRAAAERVVALVARSSGADPSVDLLLEVGAVELVDGAPSGRVVAGYVRPPRALPRQVLEAAGVDPRALAEGMALDEMSNLLAELLDGARIVCLGTARGATFVETLLRRSGCEIAFADTVVLWPVLQAAGLVSGRAALDTAAAALGVVAPEAGDAGTLAETLAEIAAATLERGVALEAPPTAAPFDFERVAFSRATLDALPETAGIYRFLDRHRRVLYVGKARSLRQRVSSYFGARNDRRERFGELLERMHDLQWEETGSELGALLAELRELRRHKPPINVQLQVRHRRKLTGSHVLFLTGADAGTVDLLLIRDGALVGQATTDRSARNMATVRKALMRAFFTAFAPREPDAAESALVASWLRQHGEHHSVLDLSLVDTLDEATRIVRDFVCDPDLFRERVFHR